MRETKTLIKILEKLDLEPETIALFTPTVQFIIWILIGAGFLFAVYEFWQRSKLLNYNKIYAKITLIFYSLISGVLFLVFLLLALSAIDSPIAIYIKESFNNTTFSKSQEQYLLSAVGIILGTFLLLGTYDTFKRTHDEDGEEIFTVLVSKIPDVAS